MKTILETLKTLNVIELWKAGVLPLPPLFIALLSDFLKPRGAADCTP